MCGIAGWLCKPGQAPPPGVLQTMARSLQHRGPDDEGFHHQPQAGLALAHRRLSILDLTAASHQPLLDPGTGVAISFNGEIYNYRSLRQQLRGLGHIFHSAGDTEVLLRSYLQWGLAALDRFAGMFAVAIWDPRQGCLHLARDAMGMKPLYLVPIAAGFAFASEIKAFLHLPGFRPRLDPLALSHYLEFGYGIEPGRAILSGVRRLAPGASISLRAGRILAEAQWYTPPRPACGSPPEGPAATEELHQCLNTVVGEHLVADVPVGLLLSGGLDSSLIAALARRHGPLTTVSMGFEGSGMDERPQARQVAEAIGSSHHDFLITAAQVQAEISSGAWVFDDLFADWGTVSTRFLYRHCRELGLKVVLVGEGADELFGGYDCFLNVPARLGLRAQFRLYQNYAGRRYGRLFAPFYRAMEESLEHCDGAPTDAIRLFESRRQLPANYVMKVDKASMAESVEARCPFLDRRVADLAYASSLPSVGHPSGKKAALKAVARQQRLLPEAIIDRHKFGGPLPLDWLETNPTFRAFVAEVLLQRGNQTDRLGLRPAMAAYFEHGRSGDPWPRPLSIYRNLAWKLLLLELWAPHYLSPISAA